MRYIKLRGLRMALIIRKQQSNANQPWCRLALCLWTVNTVFEPLKYPAIRKLSVVMTFCSDGLFYNFALKYILLWIFERVLLFLYLDGFGLSWDARYLLPLLVLGRFGNRVIDPSNKRTSLIINKVSCYQLTSTLFLNRGHDSVMNFCLRLSMVAFWPQRKLGWKPEDRVTDVDRRRTSQAPMGSGSRKKKLSGSQLRGFAYCLYTLFCLPLHVVNAWVGYLWVEREYYSFLKGETLLSF